MVSASRNSPTRITSGPRATPRNPPQTAHVRANLTLHDQRHGARMDAFDRIFQGDDIELPGGVEMVQHRRQGRRFSRPGGPGHQD